MINRMIRNWSEQNRNEIIERMSDEIIQKIQIILYCVLMKFKFKEGKKAAEPWV